jgi:carboxyl-terminal processing protease
MATVAASDRIARPHRRPARTSRPARPPAARVDRPSPKGLLLMTRASSNCLVAALAVALALANTASAEAPKEKAEKAAPRTHVLLVGISKYDDKQIKPRPHAEADVKALYDLFTSKDHAALDPKDVTLLLGAEDKERNAKKATRAAFLKALRDLARDANPQDTVIFAFVGEGGPIGKSGERRCYFLADSTFKGRDKDAVAAEEIEEALKKFAPRKFCVLLDVDFTGFVDEDKARAIAEPTLGKAPYREFLGDDNSEDHLPLPGRVAFLATNGLSPSLDLKEHGLFTKVVLDALKGKADNEGYEADGLVTVDELAKYVNKHLPELAREHGKTEKQKEQDHYVLAGPSAHYVLTINAKKLKAHKDRLAKFEEMVSNKKIPADRAEEGRALLERMPVLKKKQDLRKAYQNLVDGELKPAAFKAERKEILESMQLPRTEGLAFASKVLEAIELIEEEYVKEVKPGLMTSWAIRELYNYVEEKVPEEIEKKLKDVKDVTDHTKLKVLLAEARIHLGKREDLENLKDLNVTLLRMLHKLDPHTTYIDPDTVKKWKDDIDGNFTGIGIQIRKDVATDQLLVATPIYGSPAYKAETPMSKTDSQYPRGLWAGDIITTIVRDVDSNGNKLDKTEKTPTKGLPLNKAVKMILGQEGTQVTLMVQREGVKEPFPVTITRGAVEVESVLGARRKSNDKWDFVIDHKNKIGYLRLSSFNRNSLDQLETVMRDLVRNQGIKGFVLDLRFNPGGLLDVAIKITDTYVDDGVIVSIHPRGDRKPKYFKGEHRGSLLDFPMVCLVNGYSASGSEIVSAALQDHKRAVIMGERSYGKGSVQNMAPFKVRDPKTGDLLKAEIKLTTAAFRRPNGDNLNKASTSGKEDEKWGVVPDKVIKLTTKERRDLAEHLRNLETIERHDKREKREKELSEYKDKQLDAALEYLRGQIKLSAKAPIKDR